MFGEDEGDTVPCSNLNCPFNGNAKGIQQMWWDGTTTRCSHMCTKTPSSSTPLKKPQTHHIEPQNKKQKSSCNQ